MNQRIPKIRNEDVERIIKREFPDKSFSEVKTILEEYDSENTNGKNRVYISVLKLSNGDINELIKNIEWANKDFRDIISKAEYPNYSKSAFEDYLTIEKENQLIKEDWDQFKKWFDRGNVADAEL